MDKMLSARYKAELLIRRTSPSQTVRIAVNDGCNLLSQVRGIADYMAEQISMPLSNLGTVTATWIPRVRNDGTPFIATFAGYEETNGHFIRWDNAHSRDELHLDFEYRGEKRCHDMPVNLNCFRQADRRRIALVSLMQFLEREVDWHVPVWFYMPWSLWWDEYGDFPERLRERTPSGTLMTNMCEAVMLYASLGPDTSRAFQLDAAGNLRTMDAIMESIDRLSSAFVRGETLTWNVITVGYQWIVPFPIFIPPGSKFEGPIGTIQQLQNI